MRISEYSRTAGTLWNVWSHNFSNMFIAPLSMVEYVLAQMASEVIKALLMFSVIGVIAALAFDFNVLSMGSVTLTLAFVNLVWFGYTTGLFILGIILRVGTRIQA